MKLMIDGAWCGDVPEVTAEVAEKVDAHTGDFRGSVTAPERGRYHLYVSYACPFAHRVIIGRALKKLEGIVGMSVLQPHWNSPDGWVFGETALSTLDLAGNGFTHLHQAFSISRPDYTGRITVPILWDRTARRIVNDQSYEILFMLNDAFDGIGAAADIDLHPSSLRAEILALSEEIVRSVALGVYVIGGAQAQDTYDAAVATLFETLDSVERRLADGRAFLHGDAATITDVLLFTPMVRFDAVYNPLFRVARRRLVDLPHLFEWTRRFHRLPGVAETVRFDHILRHYYDDWAPRNPRLIPVLPDRDFRS
ncbi:MAG: glutathione S-transferase C-terminal domain-containing protein [Solimonas sp.]